MRSLIITLLLISSVLSQDISTNDCPIQISYKSWFFTPPQNSVVGFPLRNKKASADGYDRFCSYQRMRAKGVLRFYENNGKIKNTQDSLYFYYDPNSAINPADLKAIDSLAVTKAHKLYLYSSQNISVDTRNALLCSSAKWNSSMESPAREYGYGIIGLSYYDHVGSWVSAESDAIRDLLGKSAVLVASQQFSTERDFTEVTRYEYDLLVQNIRVERRWVNFDDWSCHVVVSVPKAGISVWKADSSDPLGDRIIAPEVIPTTDTIKTEDLSQDSSTDETTPVPVKESTNVTVGSKEWYKMYREAQKRQMKKSKDSIENAQEKFEQEQNEEFENHQKISGSQL